ncbi:AGE family epimerase/isomerase [Puia dinghuensis]|uniref:Cellobiose 2-epimerase n=1 Tax=Puia dinghuensis TaxID=1792502 RepID=A0A8J2UG94_9BACT|nr:AGE family epimerase/isomerase [Puia dinghuensis]GGB13122.1 cellobiose 2-epimerase [Puia dinghuensis]
MNSITYQEEMSRELQSILQYWMLNTPDEKQGGFIGRIDEDDRPHPEAPKGLVLNSRILWSFSAAWRYTGQWIYRPVATRAYDYLIAHFLDRESGGAFWSLDAAGRPLNTRKQIYGQAFALYGLSEYYRATGDQAVLGEAIRLYQTIEERSFDQVYNGYFEAFSRDWQPLEDLRLSEKDANEQKTTNTHLHVLEAYTTLYAVWPDTGLRGKIRQLLAVFTNHILDPATGHLGLFFSADWQPMSQLISYGHDIEAAWLLHEAALVIEDEEWIRITAGLCLKLADVTLEGLDEEDGGLWHEKEEDGLVREKHWWPQAEAMVGFLRAWTISGESRWWEKSKTVWSFVKHYIRESNGKEWYWGVRADHTPMPGHEKAGFWKCPYHNSRACLEVIRTLEKIP